MPLTALFEYFTAEKQSAWVLLFLGTASFCTAWLLWAGRSAFLAMCWPVVALGILELAIGVSVALKAPGQLASVEQGLKAEPTRTASAETARVATVIKNFRVFKTIEILVILASLALISVFPLASAAFAVGLGLLIQSTALLVFDSFAQQRASVYARWLSGFIA